MHFLTQERWNSSRYICLRVIMNVLTRFVFPHLLYSLSSPTVLTWCWPKYGSALSDSRLIRLQSWVFLPCHKWCTLRSPTSSLKVLRRKCDETALSAFQNSPRGRKNCPGSPLLLRRQEGAAKWKHFFFPWKNFRIFLPWKQLSILRALVYAFKVELSQRWDALCDVLLFPMCWVGFEPPLMARRVLHNRSFSGQEKAVVGLWLYCICQTVV